MHESELSVIYVTYHWDIGYTAIIGDYRHYLLARKYYIAGIAFQVTEVQRCQFLYLLRDSPACQHLHQGEDTLM